MKIKFKREYRDDVAWPEILDDFLKILSKKFGYPIDPFDLIAAPNLIARERLAKLVNENPESVTYLRAFTGECHKSFSARDHANAVRRKYKKVLEALDVGEKDEES